MARSDHPTALTWHLPTPAEIDAGMLPGVPVLGPEPEGRPCRRLVGVAGDGRRVLCAKPEGHAGHHARAWIDADGDRWELVPVPAEQLDPAALFPVGSLVTVWAEHPWRLARGGIVAGSVGTDVVLVEVAGHVGPFPVDAVRLDAAPPLPEPCATCGDTKMVKTREMACGDCPLPSSEPCCDRAACPDHAFPEDREPEALVPTGEGLAYLQGYRDGAADALREARAAVERERGLQLDRLAAAHERGEL